MREDWHSEEETARYWDDNAVAWAAEVRQGRDLAREFLNNPAFLAFIGDLHGKDVLDAGCGEGYNTRILARRGARMTGVDLSERMIALAREEERRERPASLQHHPPLFHHQGLTVAPRCGGTKNPVGGRRLFQ